MQQTIPTDNRPPHQILDRIGKKNGAVFEESSPEVNIYNYKLNNESNTLETYTEILCSVMEQKHNFDGATGESQPFIREIITFR